MVAVGVEEKSLISFIMENSCGVLLQELQNIWAEIGESKPEQEKILLEIEKECLQLYQRKVDEANCSKARLYQSLAAKEAELAALMASLGEQTPYSQVNVCWQCGDIGLSEAFDYCIKCKSTGRHRYCLEELPEDLSAEIDWLCEDCRSKSPNSVSVTMFAPPVCLGILDHGSGRAQIGLKNPCQEFGSSNDQEQHPVSNVRIDSSVNLGKHISDDFERNTTSCAISGALGTICSSSHLKQNGDVTEEFGYENSKREGPMLSDQDTLNDFQPPVEAEGTNIQFAAKRLPDTSVEASDMLTIGETCGEGAGRSSVCFGIKEDETDESKEGSKRRALILPDKDELNNFHPLINGEGTNFSLAVKRMPGTSVEPFDSQIIGSTAMGSPVCYKQDDVKIEEYKKGNSTSRMNLPTNNFCAITDGQGTSISSVLEKLPGTTVERSDSHTIGRTLSNSGDALDAVKSSVCCALKEDEIEEYGKGSSIVSCKYSLDNFDPTIDGQDAKFSSAVEKLVCEPSDKNSKRISSCGTNALDAVVSSTCSEFKGGQIEEHKDQLDDIHPSTDVQDSGIKFATKRLSRISIKACDKLTKETMSSCDLGALGVVRSSACSGLKEGEIKVHSMKTGKRKRRRSRRRKLIPPLKRGIDNFQPVILFEANNIPVVVKRVPTPITSDKRIIGTVKTSDTSGVINSSACFELKKDKSDGYGNEKSESRSLILTTKDELNCSQSVIDRRGSSKFAAKRLPATSVEPSDRPTKAQITLHSQLTSPSLFGISPIWRGCFNINKTELGPLRAHLSCRACLKVCNIARNLPSVLRMQKFPRLVAWPNSFKVSSPTVDNIALYFYPESDRVESMLDELVDDFINKDLMLRFEFDEVELLVFSSFVLPQEHQRFSGKYYAWGVFKPRSAKIFCLPADSHTEYQVGEALKSAGRSEVEDHDDELFKDSAQEINNFTSRRSLIQPGEGTVSVTADSAVACEEGNTLQEAIWAYVELL